jgi:hypothetical protein
MRVDLLLSDRKCYTYEGYMAAKSASLFTQLGMACRILYLQDGLFGEYLIQVHNHPPDWTLGFTNLTPHQKPFCDILSIPHFFWLENSFGQAFHFLSAAYGKIGLNNESLCKRLPSDKVLFLPQGVELACTSLRKEFEIVLFGDLLDLSFLEKTWQELFSPAEIGGIKKAIQEEDLLLAGPLFFYAEQYINARQTQMDLKSLVHSGQIDIFGNHAGNNWLCRLPKHMHLHCALPYREHFEVLKMSKILWATPENPWYWASVAASCLPLHDPEEIIYFLREDAEREKKLEKLREKVLERNWEGQIRKLIQFME